MDPQLPRPELTAFESIFFHITKVLIYKTVSSPFRVTHLSLQSKNAIIEQHEKNQYQSQSYTRITFNALKSFIFGNSSNNPRSEQSTPPMITYLTQTNASMLPNYATFPYGNTLNLIMNIANDPQYGVSYLFAGGLINILRGMLLQSSCAKTYNSQKLRHHKNMHIGRRYFKGLLSWTAKASSLWICSLSIVYPLYCAYINCLFDFDGMYKLPQFTLSGMKRLFAGYPISILQCILHSVLFYDIFSAESNANSFERITSKYIYMGFVNLICYPLDTITNDNK